MTATEVAQCYVRLSVAETTRPHRELKDFAKVTMKPGESREIVFTLAAEKRRYYANGEWLDFIGHVEVFIGQDSNATLHDGFVVTN